LNSGTVISTDRVLYTMMGINVTTNL